MKFQCYFCSRAFKILALYERHLVSHTKERPFKCSLCKYNNNKNADYREYLSLVRHYKKQHPRLYIEEMNRRKSKKNSKSTTYNCYFCDKSFKERFLRDYHISNHTLELGYKCTFPPCSKQYKSSTIQWRHLDRCRFNPNQFKHIKRCFPCYFCEKVLTCFNALVNHTRIHTNENPFKCHLCCSKRFSSTQSLKLHKLLQHNLGTWWQCNFCEVKKPTNSDLNQHIRSKHTRDNLLQKCYFCSKYLERVSPKHMSLHTGEKHYRCVYCPAEYRTQVLFRIHNLQHAGTPEFNEAKSFLSKLKNKCYFCQKPFTSYSLLEPHLKEHTKEKCFKCKRCGLIVYSWSDAVKNCVNHTPNSALYFRNELVKL